MRKLAVILISLILVISFIGLVWYGLRHARGIPTAREKERRVTLEAPFIDREINLSEGISLELWEGVPSQEIKLMYQVMVLPWPKTITPSVNVKAFHNHKDIYFYLAWQDDTEDRLLEMNKFSDACAVMFPLGKEAQPHTLMMGFLGQADIWQWKASQDKEYWQMANGKWQMAEAYADFHYPFEDEELFVVSKDVPHSAVNDLIAIRVGTVTAKPEQNIEGRGFWDKNRWQVIFKRSLKQIDPEADVGFNLGTKKLCAFGVWNGSKGDRGGRKSISDWVELRVH